MNPSRTALHGRAATSGGLGAAIAMAISQVVWLIITGSPATALVYGASLAAIAFGGTYAGVFFVSLARLPKTGPTTA